MSDSQAPLVECAKSYALVTLACVAIVVGGRRLGFDGYTQLGVAAVLFHAASRGAETMTGGAKRAGISLGGLFEQDAEGDGRFFGLLDLGRTLVRGFLPALRELALAIGVAALVFPPFFFGYVRWFHLRGVVEWRAPMELLGLALTQVILVAVPEEIYFRGYLQTRLADGLGATEWRGLPWPLRAIVLQAVLFGLLHFVVDPNLARLSVALPGLLFGVIRAGRGGVGAAIFFHALCNLYSETLALSVR